MRVMLIASVIDSLLRSCFVSFSISIGDIPALCSFKYGVSSSTIFSSSMSPEVFIPVKLIEQKKKILFFFNVLKIELTITTYYLSIGYTFCRATVHYSDIRRRRWTVSSVFLQGYSLSSVSCGQNSSFYIALKAMSC